MSAIVTGSLLGLALGVRHALEPDHLAAVGTFMPEHLAPRHAARMGALWGAGHALALFVLGAVALAVRGRIPGWLDSALESFVGVMLIVLGLRAILASRKTQRRAADRSAPEPGWRPLAVGFAHGAAGTGTAVLLATATMRSTWSGLFFLAVFGAGSALGMAATAGLMGWPLQRAAVGARYRSWMLIVAGSVSVAVGIWWIAVAG